MADEHVRCVQQNIKYHDTHITAIIWKRYPWHQHHRQREHKKRQQHAGAGNTSGMNKSNTSSISHKQHEQEHHRQHEQNEQPLQDKQHEQEEQSCSQIPSVYSFALTLLAIASCVFSGFEFTSCHLSFAQFPMKTQRTIHMNTSGKAEDFI